MPQLDITTYSSQVFWLLIVFAMLYLFVSRFFLPSITEVVKGRENRIKTDLHDAENMVNEQKKLRDEIDDILNTARTSAFELRTQSAEKAKKSLDTKLIRFEEELAKKIRIEEKRLENVRSQFRAELPGLVKDLSLEVYKVVLSAYQEKPSKLN